MSSKHPTNPPPPTSTSTSTPSESHYERLFNSLDVNSDGRISISDLSHALKKDIANDQHRLRFIRNFLQKSDRDKSGDVSLEEFTEYARTHEKKLKIIFTNIDRNRDGKIDFEEVLKSCKEQLGVTFKDEKAVKDMFGR
jgi:solute carrier family 25 phosphate transporter 23/24/25/41